MNGKGRKCVRKRKKRKGKGMIGTGTVPGATHSKMRTIKVVTL
jgi:hypothetical protein